MQALELRRRELEKEAEKMKRKTVQIKDILENNNEQIKEKEEKRKESLDKLSYNGINPKKPSIGLTGKIVEDYKNSLEMKKLDKLRKYNLKKELEDQMKEKEKLMTMERVYLDKKQLATNVDLIKTLSPTALEKATNIDAKNLFEDNKIMESEITRLH